MTRPARIASLLALFGVATLHIESAVAAPKPDASTVSKAVTKPVIDELAEEIERSMAEMVIPGMPGPYFIAYKVTEVEVNDVSASLGATTSKKERHFVSLDSHVHVGSYQLDNTNFAVPQRAVLDGIATVQLPLEPAPKRARRAAWLATDAAYQEALRQLAVKLEYRRSGGGASTASVPSYSVEKPIVQEQPKLVPALEQNAELEKRAWHISQVFRNQPHVRDSRVAFTSFLERRWYINSEGSSSHDTRRVSGVIIVASAQAADGQELVQYYSHYGTTARYLPTDAQLVKEAEALASALAELRNAPVMDNYTGPVLFEGDAAVDIARYTLAPNLGGTPVPEGISKARARQFGGALSDRIGKGRVLSSNLSVIDDPTIRKWRKRALIGGYVLDDEGVPSRRIEVIKNGKLKTLLTSRTPSQDIAISNGHARRRAPAGGGFHGSATNTFIVAKKGLGRRQLVKKLLAAVKDEGLPYGLIIRRIDDGAITSAPEETRRQLLTMIATADTDAPPPAVMAYRVYPNGKEELVRGVQLKPVPARAWKDIIAAGKRPNVKNFLATSASYLEQQLITVNQGFVPSSGIESAIVTPDLLFEEIEIAGSSAGKFEKPFVPKPGPN